MKGLFQNGNRIYMLSNVFSVMLCTTSLITGTSYQTEDLTSLVLDDTEIAETNDLVSESEVVEKETKKKNKVVVKKSVKKTSTTTKTGDVEKYYGSVTGDAIVAFARQYKNHKIKYKYAGRTLSGGTDCSGFTNLVYKHFGINRLGVTVEGQLNAGTKVARKNIQKGDIIIYTKNGHISHAAIYAGNGKIVHMSAPGVDVIESSIDIPGSTYYAAIRVLKYYTVKYYVDEEVIDSFKVGEQSIIDEPTDPVKEGYKFIGWYKGDKLFDFSKNKITKNTKLVAKFEEITTPEEALEVESDVIDQTIETIENTSEKTETGSYTESEYKN